MLIINGLTNAENFVTKQQAAGNDVRWEGFDRLVFFRPDPRGMTNTAGAYRGGQWGFDNVVEVTPQGTWEIDYRNVRKVRNRS